MNRIIGIDLGGTTIKGALLTEDLEIMDTLEEKTHAHSGAQAITDHMAKMVSRLMERNQIGKAYLAGIGIGTPGLVDASKGSVIYSNNFGWEFIPLKQLMEEKCGVPVAIENDANCAVLGEAFRGAAKGCRNVVLITLGTGVGSGILVNGSIPSGMGSGGVAGHMVIVKDGKACSCGKKGCLEAYASATALISRAKERLRETAVIPEEAVERINGKAFFDLVNAGDESMKQVLSEYTDYLSIGISNLIDIFRPEKVLIGGGLSGAGEVLLEPLRKKTEALCFAEKYLPKPEITTAKLKNEAGMIGAAALIVAR